MPLRDFVAATSFAAAGVVYVFILLVTGGWLP